MSYQSFQPTRNCSLVMLIAALPLCYVVAIGLADEPSAQKNGEKPPDIAPPTEKELADKRMQFMKGALAHYTIQVGEQKEPAKAADPCLRWSNPISGDPDGIIAVYTHDGGRPAAIGQFFQ